MTAIEQGTLTGIGPARTYLDRDLVEAERELTSAQSYVDDVTRHRDEAQDRVNGIRAALAHLNKLEAAATILDTLEDAVRLPIGDPRPHHAADFLEPQPGTLAYAQRQAELAGDLDQETEEETR